MKEESLLGDLLGVFKKHFLRPRQPDDQQKIAPRIVAVGTEPVLNLDKQARVQELCQQLFKKESVVASGRIQFIGLKEVRAKLGNNWENVKPLIFKTVDAVIKDYTEEQDLFFRYHDDSYVIIFAKASYEEAEIKASLIAEEIRRRMFESERTELEGLQIHSEIHEVKTACLRNTKTIEETFNAIFSVGEDKMRPENKPPPPQRPAKPREDETAQEVKVFQVDYSKAGREEGGQKKGWELVFKPVLNTSELALTTFIPLVKTNEPHLTAFAAHKRLFSKLHSAQKLNLDMQVLEQAIHELKEMEQNKHNKFICCPVHYDTLFRTSKLMEYEEVCEKIPVKMRRHVFFLIFDMPSEIKGESVSYFAAKIKKYCRYVCAEVSLDIDTDIEKLRDCGVQSLGVDISNIPESGDVLERKLKTFVKRAKKSYIPFVFVLGVKEISTVTATVVAGYDFVSGPAIHSLIKNPSDHYSFRYSDLYKQIVSRQNSSSG